MTRCLRHRVSAQTISHVTGIKTMQVIRNHYDDLQVEDDRDALRALP